MSGGEGSRYGSGLGVGEVGEGLRQEGHIHENAPQIVAGLAVVGVDHLDRGQPSKPMTGADEADAQIQVLAVTAVKPMFEEQASFDQAGHITELALDPQSAGALAGEAPDPVDAVVAQVGVVGVDQGVVVQLGVGSRKLRAGQCGNALVLMCRVQKTERQGLQPMVADRIGVLHREH